MQNYESLGRYTAFCEELKELKNARAGLIFELKRLLGTLSDIQSAKFVPLETVKFENLSVALLDIEDKILTLIGKVNSEAEICNRQKEAVFKF